MSSTFTYSKPCVIVKANPNRWPIRVIQWPGEKGYWLEETDPEGYWEQTDEGLGQYFETEAAARKAFQDRVKELADIPNWDAQAEYDEIHGTINGYAPWQQFRYHE